MSCDKLRILYLAANPRMTERLRIEQEVRRIASLIRASEHRDALELITRWEVRPKDWQQQLLETRPHVVHFSGHGTANGKVVLQGERDAAALVDHAAIVELIGILRDGLRLVVLNACYSDNLAEALTEYIDCAIGTRHDVGDEAAIEFAAGFYRALGFGKSIQSAYKLGCNAGTFAGLSQAHELVCRDGVDPNTIVLVGPPGEPADPPAGQLIGHGDDLDGEAGMDVGSMVDELISRLADQRTLGPARAQSEGVARRIDELASAIRRGFTPTEGSHVAGAELIRVIGAGNFGTIWEAETLDTGERVAVKVFRLERLGEGQMLSRFKRSIRAMRLLSEKKRLDKRVDTRGHVVRFRGQDSSSLAFAMDYLDNGNLEYIEQQGGSLERKLEVMLSVCSAVEYAHKNGVIHRDIKPANIVLDRAHEPVLTDFDIADIKWATSLSTTVEGGLGTPVFAAPEQLVDAELASERSDVYSLGRLLYYLLLERSPGYEVEKDPSLDNLAGHPLALVEIVRKATQYHPQRRYSSASEMIAELEQCHTGAAAARARLARNWRFVRKNRALLTIVALVVAGSVGFAVYQSGVAEEQRQAQLREREARKEAERESERAKQAEAKARRAAEDLKRLGDQIAELSAKKNNYSEEINRLEGVVKQLAQQRAQVNAGAVIDRIDREMAEKRAAIDELKAKQNALDQKLAQYDEERRKAWEQVTRREAEMAKAREAALDNELEVVSQEPYGDGAESAREIVRPGLKDVSPVPVTALSDFTMSTRGIVYVALKDAAPMRFVGLTGGEFIMGSPPDERFRDDNETEHRVRVSRFEIAEYEVTRKQWALVMGTNPSSCANNGCSPERPVQEVSWLDTIEFLNKLSKREKLIPCYSGKRDGIEWNQKCNGFRLPTEAEWEYACRAGSQTAYSFGDDDSQLGEYAWYGEDFSENAAHPVGGKKPNDWGLYDMHGNVWEWVWDWYGPYRMPPSGKAGIDPRGVVKGTSRVLRGGSFGSWSRLLRCGYRDGNWPRNRSWFLGFRAVRARPRQH
ncbi:MAG: SUMF1/EgtB/PvdO family nonheme iron enzyme [Proteobacteria bacterium]|nr:SUMF1/EgtB/PvdO family nonheme iron enzyme [Pseudomonadota bacterium]